MHSDGHRFATKVLIFLHFATASPVSNHIWDIRSCCGAFEYLKEERVDYYSDHIMDLMFVGG